MLILCRRAGETLTVGDDVKVTVLNITGNRVSIGVKAPNKVAVHRQEIYQKLAGQQTNETPLADTHELADKKQGYNS